MGRNGVNAALNLAQLGYRINTDLPQVDLFCLEEVSDIQQALDEIRSRGGRGLGMRVRWSRARREGDGLRSHGRHSLYVRSDQAALRLIFMIFCLCFSSVTGLCNWGHAHGRGGTTEQIWGGELAYSPLFYYSV
jgi:hypothetical protein